MQTNMASPVPDDTVDLVQIGELLLAGGPGLLDYCFDSATLLTTPPATEQEDTCDIADVGHTLQYSHHNVYPIVPALTMEDYKLPIQFNTMVHRGPPERHEFGDDVNFHVEIDGSQTNKRKYLYSAHLNRIYVNENEPFPVQFSWSSVGGVAGVPATRMVVRACVVFAAAEQRGKRVERCVQHLHDRKSDGLPPSVKMNVLQSSCELNTAGVHYCGEGPASDSWLSVAVEFPENSPMPRAHAYRLVCKNSCSSGINRREIEIIFTLETLEGKVLGRRIVGIRGCSCPRRDMKRDEKTMTGKGGKRPMATGPGPGTEPEPRSKKIKVEVNEESEIVNLPPLRLIGPRAAAAALGAALAVIECEASRAQSHQRQEYNECIAALTRELEKYKPRGRL